MHIHVYTYKKTQPVAGVRLLLMQVLTDSSLPALFWVLGTPDSGHVELLVKLSF